MEPYRKLIRVQKENNLVSRVFDRNIFWDELVKDIAEAWNEQDVSNYQGADSFVQLPANRTL